MKKYKISTRYLDKCISEIECNCLLYGSFNGIELLKFCENQKRLYAAHLLEASGDIRMVKPDNSDIPSVIFLENKGLLRSYTKYEKSVSSVKGFIVGVISTTVIPYLFNMIASQLPQLLSTLIK